MIGGLWDIHIRQEIPNITAVQASEYSIRPQKTDSMFYLRIFWESYACT